MRTSILVSISLLAPATLVAQDKPAIEVISVTAKKKPKLKLSLFGQEGLEIRMATQLKGKSVLSVDKEKSAVTSFTDDTGADLSGGLKKGNGMFFWAQLQSGFGNDKPKDIADLKIRCGTLPKPGAGKVHLQAKLGLVTAAGTKSETVKVACKKDTEFTVGPYQFKIIEAKPPKWGKAKMVLRLESKKSLVGIAKIEMVDGNGKAVKTENAGSGSMSFAGKTTYTKGVGLPVVADEATLKFTLHQQMETVVLPIDMKIGLGLSQ